MMMTLEQLREDVASEAIETVIVAVVDMQGRLIGKRYDAALFLQHVAHDGTPICSYVLDRNVEMEPFPTVWSQGFGDVLMRPDLTTLRRVGWYERTALVLCDMVAGDGAPVDVSPRQVLQRQLTRLEARGWTAMIGSELEFLLFRDTYTEARAKHYRGLRPAIEYNSDYAIFGTAMAEDVVGLIRRTLRRSGLAVEGSKGESNHGQLEINFRYTEALRMADDHAIYKDAAKTIAWQQGVALSFMPKFNEREGSSCHVHCSLWEGNRNLFAANDGTRASDFSAFLAGQLAWSRELTLLFAPNINSYKRYTDYSFAPTRIAWGEDNRTCAFRALGNGPATRVETRIGGGDCNPYMAFAAIIAMGLDGIDRRSALEPACVGNAYEDDGQRLPTTLREATALLDRSAFARSAFGDAVVDHYVQAGRQELRAFDAAVTDWELHRTFERL